MEKFMEKSDIKRFDHYVSELFDNSGCPGIAVCIRGPKGIIYDRGFGKRSLRSGLAVDGDTVMGLASLSKSFTTLALAILESEQKVSFDDPVYKYFPSFKVPGTPSDLVTLRHLAMHTAGIPPIQPLEWSIAMNSTETENEWHKAMVASAPNKMNTIDQIIDYISAGDYGHEGYTTLGQPGEYMSYSNEGYALLSYVVDQVADMPLEDFLKERIFEPLGMTRTVLDLDGGEARILSGGNITSLFEKDADGKLIEDDDFSVLPPFRGCACMKSTAHDITKYYKMLCDGGMWEGVQAIPAYAVDALVGRGFAAGKFPTYCYGIKKRTFAGKIIGEHTGALHGTSTAAGFVEGGYSAAVLCNLGEMDPDPFIWAAYNLILGLPPETDQYLFDPIDREFSDPEALTGDFLAAEGQPSLVKVSLRDGHPVADYAGTPVRLLYCGNSRFSAVSDDENKKRVNTLEFFIRGAGAWAVRCGSRIYRRMENKS